MESRGGDDHLVALAELSPCDPEPGAVVGSTESLPTLVTTRASAARLRKSAGSDEAFTAQYARYELAC